MLSSRVTTNDGVAQRDLLGDSALYAERIVEPLKMLNEHLIRCFAEKGYGAITIQGLLKCDRSQHSPESAFLPLFAPITELTVMPSLVSKDLAQQVTAARLAMQAATTVILEESLTQWQAFEADCKSAPVNSSVKFLLDEWRLANEQAREIVRQADLLLEAALKKTHSPRPVSFSHWLQGLRLFKPRIESRGAVSDAEVHTVWKI